MAARAEEIGSGWWHTEGAGIAEADPKTIFNPSLTVGILITFRPLARFDFPMMERWLAEPHVEAWWRERLDQAGLEKKYGPRIDGNEATRVFVIENGGRPVGWIQWYRWLDYPAHAAQLGAGPDAAGIDLALGEKSLLGSGFGPRVIAEFIHQVVWADPAIRAVVADPEAANVRSVRAFEKAGFKVVRTIQLASESFQRRAVRLERGDDKVARPTGVPSV